MGGNAKKGYDRLMESVKYGPFPIFVGPPKCKMSTCAGSASGDGVHICQKAPAYCYGPMADRCPAISRCP